jgi:hypothetical protein
MSVQRADRTDEAPKASPLSRVSGPDNSPSSRSTLEEARHTDQ